MTPAEIAAVEALATPMSPQAPWMVLALVLGGLLVWGRADGWWDQ